MGVDLGPVSVDNEPVLTATGLVLLSHNTHCVIRMARQGSGSSIVVLTRYGLVNRAATDVQTQDDVATRISIVLVGARGRESTREDSKRLAYRLAATVKREMVPALNCSNAR